MGQDVSTAGRQVLGRWVPSRDSERMRQRTIDALNRINLRFYSQQALEFSRTRGRPWPGWQLLLRFLRCSDPESPQRRPRLVDLGCGNGRFLHFLEQADLSFEYLGIDSSLQLLRLAAQRAPTRRWLAADLTQFTPLGNEPRFDVVAALALLHHIPSLHLRRQLLRRAVKRLKTGGLLLVSHWQFEGVSGLRDRRVEWESPLKSDINEETGLEEGDLEEGDHLLAWGQLERPGGTPYRYCHHTTDREADDLTEGLPLQLVSQFRSDGRTGKLNLYRVYRRAAG